MNNRGDCMPAGYAHYIFGEKVLASLDCQYQELIQRHLDLYHIGIHGPDILFYYKTLKTNEVKKRGFDLHRQIAYDFFHNAKEIVAKNKDEAAIAYIYGFITHFVLDHVCHHYIGTMEKELNMTHSEIESELDRKLLVDRHLDPLRTDLTRHIKVDHESSKVIAPFFQLEEKQIYQALKDLKFYLGWIKAPGKIKRNFVYLCMKIGGIYEGYHGLLINYQENQKSKNDILELVHQLDENVLLAKKLIEDFLNTKLDDVYHHNFE